jgi:hypothetical protein
MGVSPFAPHSRVWLDQFRISGFVQATEINTENELVDAGNMESSGPRQVIGDYTHNQNHTILWSEGASGASVTDNIDKMLHGLTASNGDHYIGVAPAGFGSSAPVIEAVVKLAGKPHRGSDGQLQSVSLTLAGAGPQSRSKIGANVIATATGTYSSQGQTVIAAGLTFQSVVRVLPVGGSSWSITVDIEDSSNGAAWSTMTGMSVTFTAPGAVRLTTTGGAKEFWRGRVSAINVSTGTTGIPLVVTGGLVQ